MYSKENYRRGQQLKLAREYRGLTQTKLAKNVQGLSQSNLSNFEKGFGGISEETLQKTMEVLNFPMGFLEKEAYKVKINYFYFFLSYFFEKKHKVESK